MEATARMDVASIQPGYAVYAHHIDRQRRADLGQYVGTVVRVLEHRGLHYIHVRGGLDAPNDLYIPIEAVRQVVGKQVHLNLSPEDLAGQAWHLPPR